MRAKCLSMCQYMHKHTVNKMHLVCVCVCFNVIQMFSRHMETGDDSISLGLDTDGKGLEPIPASPSGL